MTPEGRFYSIQEVVLFLIFCNCVEGLVRPNYNSTHEINQPLGSNVVFIPRKYYFCHVRFENVVNKMNFSVLPIVRTSELLCHKSVRILRRFKRRYHRIYIVGEPCMDGVEKKFSFRKLLYLRSQIGSIA